MSKDNKNPDGVKTGEPFNIPNAGGQRPTPPRREPTARPEGADDVVDTGFDDEPEIPSAPVAEEKPKTLADYLGAKYMAHMVGKGVKAVAGKTWQIAKTTGKVAGAAVHWTAGPLTYRPIMGLFMGGKLKKAGSALYIMAVASTMMLGANSPEGMKGWQRLSQEAVYSTTIEYATTADLIGDRLEDMTDAKMWSGQHVPDMTDRLKAYLSGGASPIFKEAAEMLRDAAEKYGVEPEDWQKMRKTHGDVDGALDAAIDEIIKELKSDRGYRNPLLHVNRAVEKIGADVSETAADFESRAVKTEADASNKVEQNVRKIVKRPAPKM